MRCFNFIHTDYQLKKMLQKLTFLFYFKNEASFKLSEFLVSCTALDILFQWKL